MPPFAHPGGHGAFAGGPPPFAHFLGGLMFLLFLLLLAGTLFSLRRTGRVGPPPWLRGGPGGPPWGRLAPELQARQILAERFARGEIDGDEFMERASVLNWTPGLEPPVSPRPGKKKRR